MNTIYVVYCEAVGYSLRRDTGKRFRLPSEAEHLCLRLRRAGHLAWVENEGAPDTFYL